MRRFTTIFAAVVIAAATVTATRAQSAADIDAALKAADLPGKSWTAHEWVHFLTSVPEKVGNEKMATVDMAFSVTRSGNSEVLFQWLLLAIRNNYEPAAERLEGTSPVAPHLGPPPWPARGQGAVRADVQRARVH
jgi:hypothetical protein